MDYTEFVNEAMRRLDVERDDAIDIIRAVLVTFGERIDQEDALNLAELLPEGIDQYVTEGDHNQTFTLGEFLVYVAEREEGDIDRRTATEHSQEVIGLVGEVADELDMEKAAGPLPSEFNVLFEKVDHVRRA